MADWADVMAQQSAQSAELQARWDEYFQMQREQWESLEAHNQAARIESALTNEGERVNNDALFYMQQWGRTVNKREENANAVRLGLDAPYSNTEMPQIFDHEDRDWSVFDPPANNPFDQDPTEAAEGAQDVAEGAADLAEEG